MVRKRGDVGETLVEIVLTIVIIGLTITALIASLATAGNAGNLQRISAQTDVAMRNYAEATQAAAQSCLPGAAYTVYSSPGFTFSAEPSGSVCPSAGAPQLLKLVVTSTPTGLVRTMQIRVGTP